MALLKCVECGKEMSSTAKACPHCGARRTSTVSRCWTATKVIVALLFGLLVFQCTQKMGSLTDRQTSGAIPSSTDVSRPAAQECLPSNFTGSVGSSRREHGFLIITATITNNGSVPCGVQLKVSGYDNKGATVETSDIWPASIRNIAPGAKENFTHYIQNGDAVKTFDFVPIEAKQWRQ